jgi:hypothetical protein
MADTPDPDDQDQAETLDETNLTLDGDDIANFDNLPDVLDITSAVGDAGEDEDADDEIEDETDVEAGEDADLSPRTRLEDRPDGADQRRAPYVSAEDGVIDDEDETPAGLESDR